MRKLLAGAAVVAAVVFAATVVNAGPSTWAMSPSNGFVDGGISSDGGGAVPEVAVFNGPYTVTGYTPFIYDHDAGVLYTPNEKISSGLGVGGAPVSFAAIVVEGSARQVGLEYEGTNTANNPLGISFDVTYKPPAGGTTRNILFNSVVDTTNGDVTNHFDWSSNGASETGANNLLNDYNFRLAVPTAGSVKNFNALINGVDVKFPTSQGAHNTTLTQDGAGNWAWTPPVHYEASSPNFMATSTDYFNAVSGTVVNRYVNLTTGSDTTCDGTSSAAASGGTTTSPAACAWATEQRGLDDVPNGWNTVVRHNIAAVTTAVTQTWQLHAVPGSAGASVHILGSCATPQATFTTTGAGTAVVANGVTKIAQYNFTPTVATGSVPDPITDGAYWFRQDPGISVPTVYPVLASTGGTLTLNTTVGTALSTNSPTLCSWETNFTGTTTIRSSLPSGTGGAPLLVQGIKFTTFTGAYNTAIGAWIGRSGSTFTLIDSSLSGSFVGTTSNIFMRTSKDGIQLALFNTTLVTAPIWLVGNWGSVTGVVIKTGGEFPGLGVGIANGSGAFTVSSTQVSGISQLSGVDCEVQRVCIWVTGGSTVFGATTAANASMDLGNNVNNAPVRVEYGSQIVFNNAVTGKYSIASTIRGGGAVYGLSNWTATNTTNANSDFIVGASIGPNTNNAFAIADLPQTDLVQLVRVSTSY